ncbi:type II toxin-antitoxin system YoeB family toxin [Selenomonas sp. oral taxon 920]
MGLLWEDRAWEEYLYWQTQDRKTLKRLNAISAIFREVLSMGLASRSR